MRILHVSVESDDGWLIAQGLEEPGVITQAKSLDELLANVRDAAEALLGIRELHVEFILPPAVLGKSKQRGIRRASRRKGKLVGRAA